MGSAAQGGMFTCNKSICNIDVIFLQAGKPFWLKVDWNSWKDEVFFSLSSHAWPSGYLSVF